MLLDAACASCFHQAAVCEERAFGGSFFAHYTPATPLTVPVLELVLACASPGTGTGTGAMELPVGLCRLGEVTRPGVTCVHVTQQKSPDNKQDYLSLDLTHG